MSIRIARATVRVIQGLIGGITAALLLVVTIITLMQVTGRYGFGRSFVWADEITRLLHVWMVLLAASIAPHMRITFIQDALPHSWPRRLEFFWAALSLGLLGLIIDRSVVLMRFTAGDRYMSLDLSIMYLYAALATGAALWALNIVARTWLIREHSDAGEAVDHIPESDSCRH